MSLGSFSMKFEKFLWCRFYKKDTFQSYLKLFEVTVCFPVCFPEGSGFSNFEFVWLEVCRQTVITGFNFIKNKCVGRPLSWLISVQDLSFSQECGNLSNFFQTPRFVTSRAGFRALSPLLNNNGGVIFKLEEENRLLGCQTHTFCF